MVLVQLGKISVAELKELVLEAWVSRVPKKVAARYFSRVPITPDE
jgi:hypothetical protein